MKNYLAFIQDIWKKSVIPTLCDYITIPNVSPAYDPDWHKKGFMAQATELLVRWAKTHGPSNMQLEVIQEDHRTPVIFIQIPGDKPGNILFYGHLDKQPGMKGWEPGLDPWKPVIRNDKLYGRGGADDGYSLFSALTAILSLKHYNIPLPHCSILIEASEESGSPDLPYYMDKIAAKLPNPDLIIALDSSCKTYNQIWSTSSLRGLISLDLHISVMKNSLHSGSAGGVIPSPFFILQQILSRIEDPKTGKIFPEFLRVAIPPQRIEQAKQSGKYFDLQQFKQSFDLHDRGELLASDSPTAMLQQAWEPALTVVGLSGLPDVDVAGNVLHSEIAVRLSLRTPPTLDTKKAADELATLFLNYPPYQAHVHLQIKQICQGWHAPHCSNKLTDTLNTVGQKYFQSDVLYCGEGGSIPFMAMLGEQYPHSEFLITGVLGPLSNAHGPNEFLHLPYAMKLTAAIAELLELF